MLLLNSASGGFGLNLQAANYEFFFETPSDPIIVRQCIKRAHRGGQKRKVFCYFLCNKGSVEEDMLNAIENDEDLFNRVVDGRYKLRLKR